MIFLSAPHIIDFTGFSFLLFPLDSLIELLISNFLINLVTEPTLGEFVQIQLQVELTSPLLIFGWLHIQLMILLQYPIHILILEVADEVADFLLAEP